MRALFRSFAAAVATSLAFVVPAAAETGYVAREQVDLVYILPSPPAHGSDGETADVKAVLDAQAARTPEAAERAKADAEITIFRFADVIGPDFTPEKLPITAAFFAKVKLDSGDPVEAVKGYWNRPRPSVTEPSITPVVPLPKNASYPSGHTTWARLNAIVLAGLVPEKRAEIFVRADEYANNRIVAGVHFPTDIAGGKVAGSVLAVKELENPQFKTDFEAAKKELRAVLRLDKTN